MLVAAADLFPSHSLTATVSFFFSFFLISDSCSIVPEHGASYVDIVGYSPVPHYFISRVSHWPEQGAPKAFYL